MNIYFPINGHFLVINSAAIYIFVHTLRTWYDLGTDSCKIRAWTKGCALLHLDKYCHLVYHWGSAIQNLVFSGEH